jgi:hypothetical protein
VPAGDLDPIDFPVCIQEENKVGVEKHGSPNVKRTDQDRQQI